MTAFAINSARTFQAEWMSTAVENQVGRVDAEISQIQAEGGVTRQQAVTDWQQRRRGQLLALGAQDGEASVNG